MNEAQVYFKNELIYTDTIFGSTPLHLEVPLNTSLRKYGASYKFIVKEDEGNIYYGRHPLFTVMYLLLNESVPFTVYYSGFRFDVLDLISTSLYLFKIRVTGLSK